MTSTPNRQPDMDLPSGYVTFLFSDIEGSTQLWEKFPQEMRGALANHDSIMNGAVENSGGTVVKTTGDGLMAVFAVVGDGVAACLAAQRQLTGAVWGTTGPLRVRMGIHTGEAEARTGDYFGPAVNRTARIMAAGHGGQVLLSSAAVGLVGEVLPADAGLRDLGNHRLKDLTLPEHIFQLLHPDLEADFPPLTTLSERPNNLPLQPTEFFGRAAELEAIQNLLDNPAVRLVTLTGPGGTGKTRLGLQAAADRIERHQDGVFFVDLSPERDPDSAFEAIVRSLGLSAQRNGTPLQILREKLAPKKMLLLLDNFEQVTEAASGVADLIQHCPDLEVVVTSREALRVRAERLFPVMPLGLPDPTAEPTLIVESEAVQLFLERARAAWPEFSANAESLAAIAEICISLDGLPLAIELAAARIQVLSPQDMNLRKRLDVIGGGARDLPSRQRTLRNTIEWSYELLDQPERATFQLMSVFSNARLESIEQVAGMIDTLSDLDAVENLASLVDKSLVRSSEVDGSRRFSMLLTIAEYAGERLGSDPEFEWAVRRAHAEHFAGYVLGLRRQLSESREAVLEELAAEIGNLRTAWRYWVEAADLEKLLELLDGLWVLNDARGWYHASIELTREALSVLNKTDPSHRRIEDEITLRTSLARGLIAVGGYTPEVEEMFTNALALAKEAGDAARRFPVMRSLATYYQMRAEWDKAAELGRDVLALGEEQGDTWVKLEGHLVYGASIAFMGDLVEGLPHLEKVLAMFDPTEHRPGKFRLGASPGVIARTTLALLLWQGGYTDRPMSLAAEALQVARNLNHPFSLAYGLYHVGFFDLRRGELELTKQRAVELFQLASTHDYQVWQALATVLQGVAMTGLGEIDEGLARTESGIDLYRGLTTPPVFWPLVLFIRASAFAMAGRYPEAFTLVSEAMALIPPDDPQYPESLLLLGDITMQDSQPDLGKAEKFYRSARDGAAAMGLRRLHLQAESSLTRLARQLGRQPDGTDELKALLDTFSEGFETAELIEAKQTIDDA